ncbi:MAG: hypothetical protein K2V38_25515 [Gemmataceae bacterium]|nr:hypothetical protein [Gemmataceae bacterium]
MPMRGAWGLAAIVTACACAVGGCHFPNGRSPGMTGVNSLPPAVPAEGVYLESVLLERPLGDRFLDRDLWAVTLPVGTPEGRALLGENGLRAGVLAGTPPPQLRKLLESESEALRARALTFANRKEDVLPTAGPHPTAEFGLRAELAGAREAVELRQATGGVLVRPATDGGRVRVWCEPQFQHGERQERFRPSADGTGWVRFTEVPLARYPALGFEASLGRDEYLLIGWDASQPDTLGEALFGVQAADQPRQRVLVVRARQPNPAPAAPPGARRGSIAAEAARTR